MLRESRGLQERMGEMESIKKQKEEQLREFVGMDIGEVTLSDMGYLELGFEGGRSIEISLEHDPDEVEPNWGSVTFWESEDGETKKFHSEEELREQLEGLSGKKIARFEVEESTVEIYLDDGKMVSFIMDLDGESYANFNHIEIS